MSIPVVDDPIEFFTQWHIEARACEALREPDAMTLATVDDGGMPWARIILLKGVDARGFAFYTNYNSRKGGHLFANPVAGLCFYWMPLDRQVRIQGQVARVSDAEADAYFATRSRESRIGAWASYQSRPLEGGRAELENRFVDISLRFEGQDVPRPPHWSGFRLSPDYIEFWQSGRHRLHDRRIYTRTAPDGPWDTQLLYP